MLDRGSTVDDWIEDLLLMIGSRIYCRLRVGLRSYIDLFQCSYVGVSFCEVGWDENRSSSHTCCALSLICCCTVYAICIAYVMHFQSRTFVVKRLLLIKPKLKICRLRVGAWTFVLRFGYCTSHCPSPSCSRVSSLFFAAGKLLCKGWKV